ncbi:hypothetical protein LJR016_005217 [Devosia sp. LjRoot16]|uniref:hypothetical protein n=1 Tax=Devosia sp. LjRoot16 TaxID=3342271 RepID=UPI003ECC8C94
MMPPATTDDVAQTVGASPDLVKLHDDIVTAQKTVSSRALVGILLDAVRSDAWGVQMWGWLATFGVLAALLLVAYALPWWAAMAMLVAGVVGYGLFANFDKTLRAASVALIAAGVIFSGVKLMQNHQGGDCPIEVSRSGSSRSC